MDVTAAKDKAFSSRKKNFLLRREADRRALLENADVLQAQLGPLVEAWENGDLSSPELAGAAILIFLFLIHPESAVSGKVSGMKKVSTTGNCRIADLPFSEHPDFPVEWKHLSVLDFIFRYRLRLVPELALEALAKWQAGEYALVLDLKMPTTLEMLEVQCAGSRYVTLFADADAIRRSTREARHAFDFLLHDLVHAEHFFSHPELKVGQTAFYRAMKSAHEAGLFDEALANDGIFKKEWEYLVSDMNSHPVHLMKSFQAVLQGHILRRQGESVSGRLDPHSRSALRQWLGTFFDLWNIEGKTRVSFERINQDDFDAEVDASEIEAFFFRDRLV